MNDIPKPAYGAACNGCGKCCMDQVCPLGRHFFGFPDWNGPCPALEERDGKYQCGLVVNISHWAPFMVARHGAAQLADGAAALIGAGFGCDAKVDGEAADSEARARMLAAMKAPEMIRRVEDGWRLFGMTYREPA
jgi:hypothetical protein